MGEFLGLEVDIWLILGVFLFFVGLPMFALFLEIRARGKYPIRAEISYAQGGQMTANKTIVTTDRIGYVDVKDEHGKKTGAKEWQYRRLKKPIQNFDYSFVYEKFIWFGFKKAQCCKTIAVMGEKGEEFFPVKYDASLLSFKPIFDGDRGLMLHKIKSAIEARNKYHNWLQENLFEIIKMGLEVMIVIMLFMCFMKLGDISDNFKAAINSATVVHDDIVKYMNYTNMTGQNTGQPIRQIAGVPFAAG